MFGCATLAKLLFVTIFCNKNGNISIVSETEGFSSA